MTRTNHIGLALVTAASALALASQASAGAFGAEEVSAEGMGRANAGEAARSGAAPLWWNPAAAAGDHAEVSVSLHQRDNTSEITDAGSTITRPLVPGGFTTPVGGASRISGGTSDFTVVDGGFTLPLAHGASLGFAVAHPFHLKSVLPATGWSRYDTIRARIDVTSLQGGAALQVTPWLDLGAAVEAEHMAAYLDAASPNLDPTAPDGIQRLNGASWNFGWTVGAQAHGGPFRLGASYRAAVRHHLRGRIALSGLQAPLDGANFVAPADTVFATPWALTLAGRWQATPALTLSGQIVRTGWSKYRTIEIAFAGETAAIPQDYRDTTSVALGADYALTSAWTVRGGVQYDPTPTPAARREPGVPDTNRWVYAVGASRAVADHGQLHLALAYSDFRDGVLAEETGFYLDTPAQTTAHIAGRFRGHAVNAAMGFDWRF